MGFWSKLKSTDSVFEFSSSPSSVFLNKALQEAETQPLDEFTWRIALASPKRSWIVDITLLQANAGFEAYSRGGLQMARRNAAVIVANAIKGEQVDDATVATASLAFFDTDFTVSQNNGKTRETAWNVLALDAELTKQGLKITRSAHRLNYPIAPLLFDYERVLDRFR